MRYSILVLFLIVLIGCGQKTVENTKEEPHEEPRVVISEFSNLFDSGKTEGVACYRIPSIATAPNGDLIVACDERVISCGDLRGCKDINIVIRRSEDNGKTWSNIEKVIDFPVGQSASDPSMIVDNATGTIFMFYNYMDLDKEHNIYYFHVTKSTDNGKTWSEPIDITSQISKPEWHKDFKFITSGRGIKTSKGVLLHTLVNLKSKLHLFKSDDKGNSWELIDTPIQIGDESKVVELSDGRWMINSRVNNPGYRYVHVSEDEGNTWQSKPDSSLVDPGCNASIIRYSSTRNGDDKNILIFANANDKKERKNLTVKISYDEGETWSEGKSIYKGEAAYSTLTILENGDIGLLFERDDYTKITFVSFSLGWLIY